ncbi:MAG: hypothetical protein SGI88_16875 [Candidatus Hydrogenedentes bacterium]|nr:hypothetical protein [Candidatus Hydrogenedentota bacterium]
MQEPKRYCSEPWRYTMTAQESCSWREGDRAQRQELLLALAARAQDEALDHRRSRYLIMDADGEIVAKGRIHAPNIMVELEAYRQQIQLN